ncbi:MAG: riboflavin synthase [Chlorobi bacterium]|nr:riboflavin synthase [Chlorobiota bacterium]
MFTGLVEEIGTVEDVAPRGSNAIDITIKARSVLDDLKKDDSIALNGCCQTVIQRDEYSFTVTAVEETLKKTTLGLFKKGRNVNLERALRAGDRLGGHCMLGHVDTLGTVVEREDLASSWLFRIEYPEEYTPLVIPVGSIAIDGVSLTTAEAVENVCMVSIIPHTFEKTTFGQLNVGDTVNLEFDMLGKYVQNMVQR